MSIIIDSIKLAWFQSKKNLFSPFDKQKWLAFGLLALLSGITVAKQPLLSWVFYYFLPWYDDMVVDLSTQTMISLVFSLLFISVSVIIAMMSQFLLFDSTLKNKVELSGLFAKYGLSTLGTYFSAGALSFVCMAPPLLLYAILNHFGIGGLAFAPVLLLLYFVSLVFFGGVFKWIFMPSMLTMKMRGVPVWDAMNTIMYGAVNSTTFLFSFVIAIIEFFISVIIWFFTLPIYWLFVGAMQSNYIMANFVFCILAGMLSIICFPLIGIFLASFAMAYTSKAFPEYSLLLAVYDGDGTIIDSETMYDLEKAKIEEKLLKKPVIEPWQQLSTEEEQANEANFETPFDKLL